MRFFGRRGLAIKFAAGVWLGNSVGPDFEIRIGDFLANFHAQAFLLILRFGNAFFFFWQTPGMAETPRVGIGIILQRPADGRILLGQRVTANGWAWQIPGGKLDIGEKITACAAREVAEETGLSIRPESLEFVGVRNNLELFRKTGTSFVSIIFISREFASEPQALEPEKCASWSWHDPADLPAESAFFSPSWEALQAWRAGEPFAE